MTSLINILRGTTVISQFLHNLDREQIHVSVGKFGGRHYYTTNPKESLPLNEIVKTLDKLFKQSQISELGTSLVEEYARDVRKILNRIKSLDDLGAAAVNSSSLPVRILTKIKSFFSGCLFNRASVLQNLKTKTDGVLKRFDQNEAANQKSLAEQQKRDADAKAESERLLEEQSRGSELSLSELLKTFAHPTEFLRITDGGETSPKAEPTSDQLILRENFIRRASALLAQNPQGLAAEFSALKDQPEAFKKLAISVASDRTTIPAFLCHFLETLDSWPTLAMKKELMPRLATIMIDTQRCLIASSGFVSTDNVFNSTNGFMANKVLIDAKRIIGAGDFTQTLPACFQEGQISDYLAEAIGLRLKAYGARVVKDLAQTHDQGKLKEDSPVGFGITLSQATECRFNAKMFIPLLAHLRNIPGLIYLDLHDVGSYSALDFEAGLKAVGELPPEAQEAARTLLMEWKEKVDTGFGDKEAALLLDIIDSNPYLITVKWNTARMSPEGAQAFTSNWGNILARRGNLPGKQGLLKQITSS